MAFYPRGRGGGSASGLKIRRPRAQRATEVRKKARGQVVLRQRCMYMGVLDDFSKAFPIVLGPRLPASLQFFLADHCRVIGVRCQN